MQLWTFNKNGYMMCTVKFNTLKIPAHYTKMHKKHWSLGIRKKNNNFPLCLICFDTVKEKFSAWQNFCELKGQI